MTRYPGYTDDSLDPEVIADLRLRDSTARDRSRGRDNPYVWTEPVIVESWPCRRGCQRMVGVTKDGLDQFAKTNEWLRRRGEKPLTKREVMICDECKAELAGLDAAARRPHEQRDLALDNPNRRRKP